MHDTGDLRAGVDAGWDRGSKRHGSQEPSSPSSMEEDSGGSSFPRGRLTPVFWLPPPGAPCWGHDLSGVLIVSNIDQTPQHSEG